MKHLDLTVAIPAHDDEPALTRLLSRLSMLDLAQQIIVVDDASRTPIDTEHLSAASQFDISRLVVLHQTKNKGAGAARNRALSLVKTSHVLFLDADDLPTRELRGLCADLAGRVFDFCLFQHHDSRMDRDKLWGQMSFDQMFWTAAGVEHGALSEVSPKVTEQLVQTANYPWNKIYRTAFLHDNEINCSETFVHNDIEMHWRSFLQAKKILASDRIAAIHFVHPRGGRLTNCQGAERLGVFTVLEKIAVEIQQNQADDFSLPYFLFILGLLDWINDNLKSELKPRFAQLSTSFLDTHLPQDIRQEIARLRPELYARVIAAARIFTP